MTEEEFDILYNKAVKQSKQLMKDTDEYNKKMLKGDRINDIIKKNKISRINNGFIRPNGNTLQLVSDITPTDIIKYKAEKMLTLTPGVIMKFILIFLLLSITACSTAPKAPENNPNFIHHENIEVSGKTWKNIYEVKLNDSLTYMTFDEESPTQSDVKHEYIMCNKTKSIYTKDMFLASRNISCDQ